MPMEPTFRPAEITLAVDPPASEETKALGSLFSGPTYFDPVIERALALSGFTGPSPVAYTMMVSPGTAGLFCVRHAPAILAQHSVGLITPTDNDAVELTPAEIAIPFPSGPATLARRRMRVNAPAAEATTFSSGLALISANPEEKV